MQSRVAARAPPGWSAVGRVAGGRVYCGQGLQTVPRRSSGRDHRPLGLQSPCHRVEALLSGKVCYCCARLSPPSESHHTAEHAGGLRHAVLVHFSLVPA